MTSSASSSSDNAIPSRADRIAGYRESLPRIGTGDVKVGASIGATIRVGKTKKRVQRTIDVLVERESLDAAVDAILAARAKIAALGEVENLVREGHLDESVLAEHRAEIDAELAGTAEWDAYMAILADALYGVADAQMLVARLHAVARKSNHAYIEQAINRLVSGRSVTTAPSASDATVAAAPATPLMTAPSAGDAAVTAAPTIQAIPWQADVTPENLYEYLRALQEREQRRLSHYLPGSNISVPSMPGVVQTAKGLERNIADFLRRMATLGFEPRYMPTGSLNPDSLPIYNRSHISSPGQFILSGEWVFVEKVSTHADTGSDSVGAYIRAAADSATFVPKEDMDFFDTNDGQTLALARDDAEQRLTDIEAQISRTKAQKIRLFGSREDELKRLEQEKATRIDARDSAKTLADIHQSIHAAINLRKASLSDSKNPRVITNPDLLHKESFWQKMAESMGLNPNQVRLESMAEFMLVLKTGSPDRADSFRKGNHGVWLWAPENRDNVYFAYRHGLSWDNNRPGNNIIRVVVDPWQRMKTISDKWIGITVPDQVSYPDTDARYPRWSDLFTER